MRVLRPSQPRQNCEYAEDYFPTTFHIGAIAQERIVSNGTFMLQSHSELKKVAISYRLRGMATDPTFQGQGLGRKIIEAAEVELLKRNCDLLWFNARVSAEAFYRKLGYTAIENIFEIETVGPHKVMYKYFNS